MSNPSANGNGKTDNLSRIEEMIANVLLTRSNLFQQLLDPRRSINQECGYPDDITGSGIGSINPELYRTLYERECIATRVVQVMPKESWQVTPLIYEDDDADTVTPFEEAWDALGQSLRGERSWYVDEQGSPIWEHLKRVDILSGIGTFGILLLGINDGKNLDQPVEGVVSLNPDDSVASSSYAGVQGTDSQYLGVQLSAPEYPASEPYNGGNGNSDASLPTRDQDNQDDGYKEGDEEDTKSDESDSEGDGKKNTRKLLFLRSFDESLVQIVQYEADLRNPRFGHPVMYRVTLNDPREQHSGIGIAIATVRVHWSRVIHIADNLGTSEVFGVPRMRPVLNRLLDLRKIYSGDAEAYWRNMMMRIFFETVPQLGGDVEVDNNALKDMMEQMENGLQRWGALMGMSAKTVAPSVVDPTAHIAAQLEAICIQLGIPIRVFKGSERGELASSQDDASWNDRLRERQNGQITPRIIIPFINRLISMGVLPEPGGSSNVANPTHNRLQTERRTKFLHPNGRYLDKFAGSILDRRMAENIRTPGDRIARDDPSLKKESTVIKVGGYHIEWPDLDSLGNAEKAGILFQKTQAYAAYLGGNVETIIPPLDFMTRFDNLTEEQAQEILLAAAEANEEVNQSHSDMADEHGFEPTPPPGYQSPEPPPMVPGQPNPFGGKKDTPVPTAPPAQGVGANPTTPPRRSILPAKSSNPIPPSGK